MSTSSVFHTIPVFVMTVGKKIPTPFPRLKPAERTPTGVTPISPDGGNRKARPAPASTVKRFVRGAPTMTSVL